MKTLCPLCGGLGESLRKRNPSELKDFYQNYTDLPLSENLVKKYLEETISEFGCKCCCFRWYAPGILGESDFYEHLGQSTSYYNPDSWDKRAALRLLNSLKKGTAVDVGCGDGWLIHQGIQSGWTMNGTELNANSIKTTQASGLDVHHPNDPLIVGRRADVLVSLQTLEHVEDPVGWIRCQVNMFSPKYMILAVPACDTILGYTSDPLVWPPHHRTLWSGPSLTKLASLVGFDVVTIEYEDNDWNRFNSLLSRESNRKLWSKPKIPTGIMGRLIFSALKLLHFHWAARAHSVIALLKKKTST